MVCNFLRNNPWLPGCNFSCFNKCGLPSSLNSSADQLLSTCLVWAAVGRELVNFVTNLKVAVTLETYMHVHIYISYSVYIHTCTYMCMHVVYYTCMYVCMCVYR